MAKKKFYRPVLYGIFVFVRSVFWYLPYRWGFGFAGRAGAAAFRLAGRERRKTLEHLAIAFPDISASDREKIGERMFRHYGHLAAELTLAEKSLDELGRLITVSGREHFDAALANGRGVIALTAHLGNWELLGGHLSLCGYPGTVVARRLRDEFYDRMLVRVRAKMKLETVYRDDSAREVLRALKRNRVVGFVADQDVDTIDGVFVDFFGRPAYTPSAPVRIAQKTGAPIVPCYIVREGMRHRILIEPPIELVDTGSREADLVENTRRWVQSQERMIRRFPHLWVWNHKRWKSSPKTADFPSRLIEQTL